MKMQIFSKQLLVAGLVAGLVLPSLSFAIPSYGAGKAYQGAIDSLKDINDSSKSDESSEDRDDSNFRDTLEEVARRRVRDQQKLGTILEINNLLKAKEDMKGINNDLGAVKIKAAKQRKTQADNIFNTMLSLGKPDSASANVLQPGQMGKFCGQNGANSQDTVKMGKEIQGPAFTHLTSTLLEDAKKKKKGAKKDSDKRIAEAVKSLQKSILGNDYRAEDLVELAQTGELEDAESVLKREKAGFKQYVAKFIGKFANNIKDINAINDNDDEALAKVKEGADLLDNFKGELLTRESNRLARLKENCDMMMDFVGMNNPFDPKKLMGAAVASARAIAPRQTARQMGPAQLFQITSQFKCDPNAVNKVTAAMSTLDNAINALRGVRLIEDIPTIFNQVLVSAFPTTFTDMKTASQELENDCRKLEDAEKSLQGQVASNNQKREELRQEQEQLAQGGPGFSGQQQGAPVGGTGIPGHIPALSGRPAIQ